MKIICIGRNYADHAKEMNSALPKEPIFFLKPDTALTREKSFYLPKFTNDLHFECEIVVKIDKAGKNIPIEFAHKYYTQYTLGIDFTARDVQSELKKKGLPWEKAKAWDNSAVLGTWNPIAADLDRKNISFSMKKNGELVQSGNTRDMIHSFDQIIAHVSNYFSLNIGDVIFTGTPKGVGECSVGDELEGYLGDQSMFKIKVH